MAVAVHLKPLQGFELAAYMSINLAREDRGLALMKYDQLFRQATAVNLELPWHKREPDIWLMTFMDAARPPAIDRRHSKASLQHSARPRYTSGGTRSHALSPNSDSGTCVSCALMLPTSHETAQTLPLRPPIAYWPSRAWAQTSPPIKNQDTCSQEGFMYPPRASRGKEQN